MRKFLLTLLFIVFANPVFAEDLPAKPKSEKKQNIKITISADTTSSLKKITANFNKFRTDNICTDGNKNSTIDLNNENKQKLTTICPAAKTIQDIYNCVCDKTNGTFYNKLKIIIEFKSLSENTNKKEKDITAEFKKLKEYYDALNHIPDIEQLSQIIKDTNSQYKRTQTELAQEKEALIDTFTNKLKTLLTTEKTKRDELNNEDPDIVKNLTCNDPAKCLEKHNATTNADINDWVVNKNPDSKKGTIDERIKEYIKKVIEDKKFPDNAALKTYLDSNDEPEIAKTIRNIEKLKNAGNKNKDDKDNALEKLAQEKNTERNLIKQIVDTINSGKKEDEPKITADLPESITTDNCNSKETNEKLSKQLKSSHINTSGKLDPHPYDPKDTPDAPQAKTVQKIQEDINRTIENNKELEKRLKEIQTEQVNKKFDKIKELLHRFNMKECTLYGQIDEIMNRHPLPFAYDEIGASGTSIKPLGETECAGLQSQTITQIQAITDTNKKDKWLTCLDKKVKIIDNNITSMKNYIETNFESKYPKSCKFECVYEDESLMTPLYSTDSDLQKYKIWYKDNGSTKQGYKNPTNKITIEKQALRCELNSYQCPDRTITLSETERKNARSKEDLEKLCKDKKEQKDKDNYKNNYDCKDDKGRSLPANTITQIKNALNEFDKGNDKKLNELKTEGDRLCAEANEQFKKQNYIDNYTCNDIEENKITGIKAELQNILDNSDPKPTLQALQEKGSERCSEEQRNAKQKAIDEFNCTYEGEVLTDATTEIKRKMNDKFDTFANAKAIKDFGKDECDRAQQYQREQTAKAAEIEAAKNYVKQHIEDMCKVYEHCKHSITNEYGHVGPQTGNAYDQSGEFKDENYTNPDYLSYNNSVVIPYAEKIFIIYKNLGKKPINELITEQELKSNDTCRLIGVTNAETVTGKVFFAYLKTHPRKPARGGGYDATYPNAEIIVNINK